jgi:hypothetical protein
MLNIEYSWQLKLSDLININYYDKSIKKGCIVLKTTPPDDYFIKGIVVYLNGTKIEVLDLENNIGLYVVRVN